MPVDDISFSFESLSQFNCNTTMRIGKSLKVIAAYLKRSIDFKIDCTTLLGVDDHFSILLIVITTEIN